LRREGEGHGAGKLRNEVTEERGLLASREEGESQKEKGCKRGAVIGAISR